MKRLVIAGVIAAGLLLTFLLIPPSGPRSLRAFDPERVADLELDMWQAYYRKERFRLFQGLVTLLHEQNRYSWAKALQAGFYLARAAARFGDLRDGYDTVLPDLERAYAIQKDWFDAAYDPAAVARAELAWWVARRVPGRDSPEEVGGLIADENALIYNVPREKVLAASVLRARAGKLRDQGGDRADWPAVHALLRQSFQELHAAVQEGQRAEGRGHR
jgi:hypothetical protein